MRNLEYSEIHSVDGGLFPGPRDWFGVGLGAIIGVGLGMAGVDGIGGGLIAGTVALLASNVSGGDGNMGGGDLNLAGVVQKE